MLSSPAEIESIGLKYILEPFTNDIGEGREGVKWELGFAFFRGWEMGFCALGLGFLKKNNRKMGMGFQFEQHRLGLWDLSWNLKKTISWEMGLGPLLHDPLERKNVLDHFSK